MTGQALNNLLLLFATSRETTEEDMKVMGTILVVDDDADIVKLIRMNLDMAGYNVLTAKDGVSALAIIRSERPALVIMEIAIPLLHGLRVVEETRQDSSLRDTQFILIAETATDEEVLERIATGARWLTKPLNPVDLMRLVQNMTVEQRLAA